MSHRTEIVNLIFQVKEVSVAVARIEERLEMGEKAKRKGRALS